MTPLAVENSVGKLAAPNKARLMPAREREHGELPSPDLSLLDRKVRRGLFVFTDGCGPLPSTQSGREKLLQRWAASKALGFAGFNAQFVRFFASLMIGGVLQIIDGIYPLHRNKRFVQSRHRGNDDGNCCFALGAEAKRNELKIAKRRL